jgi:VCBS repeat protein
VLFDGKGKGEFAPRSRWLEANKRTRVRMHGDPFLVDWDGDGDLDLLSGSSLGGAFLFSNEGSRTKPRFGKSVELLEPAGQKETTELGDAHLRGPSEATRLWADDVNGDGKLDLLVGDNVTLYHAVEGVEGDVARQKLAEWRAALSEAEKRGSFQLEYERLGKQREAFVREDRTGFVWVLYRK